MDKLTDALSEKIQKKTGIVLTNNLQPAIIEHISRRMEELNLPIEAYCTRLELDDKELEILINATTVNETYFFRDETHYDFLSQVYFPSRNYSTVRIWCGACSTGEEPISIYALTKHLGINADITATDINTETLAIFKKGEYTKKSFRADGLKYHRYLQGVATETDGIVKVNPEVISRIHISYLNLNRDTHLPFVMENFDLIILRNVFIYFTREVIMKILSQIWAILKTDGILLLTTNEIAAIPENDYFEKKKNGYTYYLQKKKKVKKAAPEKKTEPEHKIFEASPSETFSHTSESEKNLISELKINPFYGDKSTYKDVMKSIDMGNFSKAESLLAEMEFSASNLEYKYFLMGLIAYQKAKYQEAEVNFYKSTSLNQTFWPGTIMLAFTYKHIGKDAKSFDYFEQSLNILMEYVKTEKTCYNFTIEFDPVYIINLCRNNMAEMRKSIGE